MGIAIPAKATEVHLQWDSWAALFPWRVLLPFSILGSTFDPTSTSLCGLHVPISSRIPALEWLQLPEARGKSASVCLCVLCLLLSNLADTWELIWKLQTVSPTEMKSEEIRLKRTFYFCMLFFFSCVSGWLILSWGMRISWSDRFQNSKSVQPTVLIA